MRAWLVALLFAGAPAGASAAQPGVIRIDGSSTVFPIVEAAAAGYRKAGAAAA